MFSKKKIYKKEKEKAKMDQLQVLAPPKAWEMQGIKLYFSLLKSLKNKEKLEDKHIYTSFISS